MILAKIEKDADTIEDIELTYVKGGSGWDRESHLFFENLKKGDYYLFVEMDWDENTEDTEFCATAYGAARTFYLRDEKTLFNKEDLLKKLYASRASQGLEDVQEINFEDRGAPDCKKFKGFSEEGYGFIYIVNDEKDASFKETVNFKNFTGLTMCKPQKG